MHSKTSDKLFGPETINLSDFAIAAARTNSSLSSRFALTHSFPTAAVNVRAPQLARPGSRRTLQAFFVGSLVGWYVRRLVASLPATVGRTPVASPGPSACLSPRSARLVLADPL
ncbi:hypothetical protein L596_014477 [Steinernema carpocapsae]|uniref:Uncharacterized protein n=1 Tax=Steinernema carpocapsae TaxID=34508 RepID=A0A4U5NC20_STECR|nr:hypothetical protein L596_014477 [Steinernema carpocapsae]